MQTAFIIICGICVITSFYFIFSGYLAGEGIPWIFAALGVLFGIPLLTLSVKLLGSRSMFFMNLDWKLNGEKESKAIFVPHWFIVTAITVTLVLVFAAIIIPLFVR